MPAKALDTQEKVRNKMVDSYKIVSDILNYKMLPQMLDTKKKGDRRI